MYIFLDWNINESPFIYIIFTNKINMKNILLISIIFCLLCFSCTSETKTEKKSSNMLYEVLFDFTGNIKGAVKSVSYVGRDLELKFDCNGNLSQLSSPKENITYNFIQQGDTIINQVNPLEKTINILNKKGRIYQSISLERAKAGDKWNVIHKETYSYASGGDILEINKESPYLNQMKQFTIKKKYNYLPNGTVEIESFGKDVQIKIDNGLLRKEVCKSNEKGDWASIEETDEDGIPIRTSSFEYSYDLQNNWTQIITVENNNYTGKVYQDTLVRTIEYYDNNDCK